LSRGLPLDKDFKRKRLWAAMAEAFDHAPRRDRAEDKNAQGVPA
jgi:endo-1,4-beta-xylanase